MPPKGVQTLAVCVSERQAQVIADSLDMTPHPDMELTDWLGEERCVIRVRRTPRGVEVQAWPLSAIEAEQADADDLPFDRSGDAVAFP